MLALFAVRQTEGWTAGSVTAGLILAVVVIAGIVWVIDRTSR